MRCTSSDALAIVEAGFDLTVTEPEWLARITEAVARLLTGPLGTVGYSFRRQLGLAYSIGPTFVAGGDPSLGEMTKAVLRCFSIDDIAACFRAGGIMSSVESCVMPMPRIGSARGLPEFCGLVIGNEDDGVTVGAPLPQAAAIRPAMRRQWRRISAHLTSLRRLRKAVRELNVPVAAEAVFTPSGQPLHLAGAARSRLAREALSAAVVAMAHARGRLRHEQPELALDLWRELVAGRWTLIEKVEYAGRRFIIALPNPSEAFALRQLTPRENVLLRLLTEGRTAAEIAVRVGLSRSAVSQGVRTILTKLRQPSVAALVSVANDLRNVRHVATSPLADLGTCAVDMGVATALGLRQLTPAEREVARHLLEGLSTTHIAELRGSAYRTVANQIARIYDKLGASSRAGLGRKLAAMSGASRRPGLEAIIDSRDTRPTLR